MWYVLAAAVHTVHCADQNCGFISHLYELVRTADPTALAGYSGERYSIGMRIRLEIQIGHSGSLRAFKFIELPYTPMIGMRYIDGTWETDGPEIVDVALMFPPGEESYVAVILESDKSDPVEVLGRHYQRWDWKVV